MAISARQASLAAQRSGELRRRILAPRNTAVSTIAKNTAKAQLDEMVKRYNDGLIGNEEMQSFLALQMNNPGLTASEKVEIENKMRDFQVLVRKDALEAVFKSAPENSLQKVSAAQSLANFYTDRANQLVAGTPAHSTALENAATWNNQATTIQNNVESIARKNMRYTMEAQINQLPSNSSQQAYERAQMYNDLAQQAATDGDQTEANRLISIAQRFSTLGDEYSNREQAQMVKANRSAIAEGLNQAINDYHDGKLDGAGMAQVLQQVDQWAVENNDSTLLLKVNSLSDKIAKDAAKGGLRRSVYNGLNVVIGKGAGGGSITGYDQERVNYNTQMFDLYQKLRKQEISPEQYTTLAGVLITERDEIIASQMEEYANIEATNPTAKVMFNGKRTNVSAALEQLRGEYDDIAAQADAVDSGSLGLLQTDAKAEGVGKKSVPVISLINTNNPDYKNKYQIDDQGVLHPIKQEYITLDEALKDPEFVSNFLDKDGNLNKQMLQDAINAKGFMDSTNTWRKIEPDSGTGNILVPTGRQYVNIQSLTGDKPYQEFLDDPTKPVRSLMTIQSEVKQAAEQEQKRISDFSQKAKQIKETTRPEQFVPTEQQSLTQMVKPALTQAAQRVQKIVQPVQEQTQKIVEDTGNTLENVAMKATQVLPQQIQRPAQQAVQAATPVIKQAPIAAATNAVVNKAINYQPSTPSLVNSAQYKPVITVNNQQMVKQATPTGIVYQPVKAPTPAPAPKPSLATTISDIVKQSPISFFTKKLFGR